ncbi:MAG: hypothetical protein HY369_00935 [Candidatus Aenigmarchaeota archaeon]|nr:hypothetical protein [Candidatus Aenigmarchaeota archaeon]
MKQSLLLGIVLLLVLAAPARAQFQYYGIEDTINDDLSVRNVITIKFQEPVPHLDYRLNFAIDNLEAKSTFPSADCAVAEGDTISCDFVGMTEELNQLTLSFTTTDVVKEEDGKFLFTVDYGFPATDQAFVLIRLPETAILSEDVANNSYFPQDGGILSDGRRIMVFWERQNVSQQNLQFSVSYVLPILADVPGVLIATVAGIVIIVMVGLLVMARKKRPAPDMTTVLNPDEKAIVDILQREGGKALQKVLVRDTNFSKAKVSRLIKDMKSRRIVDIEPVSGRENRILFILGKKEKQPEKPAESAEKPGPDTPPA